MFKVTPRIERQVTMHQIDIERFRNRAKELKNELSKYNMRFNSYKMSKSEELGFEYKFDENSLRETLLKVTAFLYDINGLLNHYRDMEEERINLLYALCPTGETNE